MGDIPLIAITMGDPSGIGPEIIAKALFDPKIYEITRPIVFGDPGAFLRHLKGQKDIPINEIVKPSEASARSGQLDIIPLSRLDRGLMVPGKPTVEGGKAMVNYITSAVEMARQGLISAVVTCPISKVLMHKAGHFFDGHTQLISHLTNTDDYVMMLAGDKLRVALATIHCALKDVPAMLDEERIFRTIAITFKALCRDFGFESPKLAVAALNPHAGESGLFGDEEEKIIKPAIHRAKSEGYPVEGPFPADTLFYQAASGRFDAVVAMYHDQGLGPLKLLHFSDAVNITLGLSIIRTSVDHGTAYDIAGKGIADPSSLKAAIRTAVMMVRNRLNK